MVMRAIPFDIKSVDELCLPAGDHPTWPTRSAASCC